MNRNKPEVALPIKMTSLLPNEAMMYIETSEPKIPVTLIIIGNVFYNLGNTPSIRSPEQFITEGPPKNGC